MVIESAITISIPRCPRNEVYTCCGPCVQKSCRTIKETVYCLLPCTEGCVCRNGYVRRVPDGLCVPIRSCQIQ
uniref:TIL domain-containing protein n=1 Tax=Anopheles epiroticus TaxID=199890 RepID=A0A182P757_9DIPT